VCDIILSSLEQKRVAIISQDSFYKSIENGATNVHNYNFDHPGSSFSCSCVF
jgi:uridine kinase